MIKTVLTFAALAALLVGAYRFVAQRYGWVDTPNIRSSHQRITPRGAGIVIALLTMAGAPYYASQPTAFCASLLPGLGVAAIGWWDDLRGLPTAPRFLLYGLCGLSAVIISNLWPAPFSAMSIITVLIVALALLWSINLYNFMDGINGLATLEAIFVLISSLALAPHSFYADQLQTFIYCLVATLCGFLLWNFPRAKVFMGDVGSAFLGFLLGLLALWSSSLQGPSIAVWLILLAVFIADTGYTLTVRICTGQRWYQAHRTHAYQCLNQLLHSHSKTVAVLMSINILWLLPWAWVLQNHWVTASLALPIAYVPLLALCYTLRAGVPAKTGV